MFPLSGKEFPTSAAALGAAIHGALAETFALSSESAVIVTGGEFPAVGSVAVDLDGASISATEPPPRPVGVGPRRPGVTVARLSISGHPIRYRKARLDLDLTATGVKLDFDRDGAGRPMLVLAGAEDGRVLGKIGKGDLQAVALEAATMAAKQQGVAVQELTFDLTQAGPRGVSAAVRVKAKKMMMSGVVNIAGRLDVDDDLTATLSGLTCTGEGIIGGAAAGMLQAKLRPLNGKRIPLTAFSLGDVTLRDLTLRVGADVEVSAAFGGK
jgi:hypothetical protein